MNRGLLIALAGGLASGLFFLAIRTGAPGAIALTYISSVPLLLVGLSQGLVPVLISIMIAICCIFFGLHAKAVGIFIVIASIPAIIVVRQSLFSRQAIKPNEVEWYPIGHIIGWLTACGLLFLALISIYAMREIGSLSGVSENLLKNIFSRAPENSPQATIFIQMMANYLPGMLLSVWLLISIINSVLSQNVLCRFGFSIRPRPLYTNFNLPNWMSIALAFVILLSLIPGILGEFGRNAAPLLSTPFFLLGLAVIHNLSHRVGARGAVLAGVYILLIIVGWLSAIVVLLGVLEQWISLRTRYPIPGRNQENK
ncbi:MAG: DUF2232 domain-containing protein [Pseudomonadota bacterium]|nr:DUF2232 domain-containing protein [Pseudomonadota bacterium]